MSNKFTVRLIIAFLIFASGAIPPPTAWSQMGSEQWLQKLESGETDEKVAAIRALSTMVVRQLASSEERRAIRKVLEENARLDVPVIRLAANVELLKMGAAEDDDDLTQLAMQAINDADINVRRGMVKFFRTLFAGRYEYGKVHEPLLHEQLDDEDLEVRYHAAATLHSWDISSDRILEILIDSLDMQNYRAAGVYSLVMAKKDREKTIAMLLERLQKTPHNAGVHINLISLMTPESNATVRTLIPFYDSDVVSVRAAVIDALGRIGQEKAASIEVLKRAFDDPSSDIRRLALDALVRLEPDRELLKKSLLRLIKDEDEQVALAASDSFSFFENSFDQLLPEIGGILDGDNDQHVIAALNGCMTSGPLAVSATPAIIRRLQNENADVRIRACWALHEVAPNPEIAIAALNELLAIETDREVVSAALNSLSLLKPADSSSREHFLTNLNDSNPFVRHSCVVGLGNYKEPELADRLLRVLGGPSGQSSNQLTQLDMAIVEALVATGDEGAKLIAPALEDADPFIRSRALRAVGRSGIVDQEFRTKILSGLDADSPLIQLSAADAVSRFPQIDAATLKKIFAIASPNNRQQTIWVLELLAGMGEKASPATPDIASLMNGGFRNRFANEAKMALVAFGQHAAPAVPQLLEGPLTLHKLDCIAAIGPAAVAATEKLKSQIEQATLNLGTERSLQAISLNRRTRLAASMALWAVTGETGLTTKIIREELPTEAQPLALAAIAKIARAENSLIDDVIALLPAKKAITTLGEIGEIAKPAIEPLQSIASQKDPELAYLANRAIWQITDNPQLAVDMVEAILHENRFESVDIRIEDRQRIWETLRYLATRQESHPAAKKLLQEIQRGRFPGLREFVRQLPTPKGSGEFD